MIFRFHAPRLHFRRGETRSDLNSESIESVAAARLKLDLPQLAHCFSRSTRTLPQTRVFYVAHPIRSSAVIDRRYKKRLDIARSTSLRAGSLAATGTSTNASCYRDAICDSRMATFANDSCGCARHEWLFRLRFAQSRVAQLDLAPTLAVFDSRSVISTRPRFAKGYSARAKLAVFAETRLL